MAGKDIYISKDNLDNPHQRQDATETVYYRLIRDAYEDGFMLFNLRAMTTAQFVRMYDRRTKVGREYLAAYDEVIAALGRYDRARAALKEWAIKKKIPL